MTSRPGRAPRARIALLLALALVMTPWSLVLGADRSFGSTSNSQLLLRAARAVARQLIAQAPLTPGARVALRADAGQGVESDVADALVMALNARSIDCVVLPPLLVPAGEPTGLAPAADSAQAPATGEVPSLGAFAQLQAERGAQAARADSIARASGATPERPIPAPASVLANGGAAGSMSVVSYRVPEARVDYVRMFRGGLFGAERIERRATVRIALRITSPASDAVRWSATADTTISDVVMHSEISALEDRQRPETRPLAPSSGLKKIVEPVLVVVLIAGLVSLFYQNRP